MCASEAAAQTGLLPEQGEVTAKVTANENKPTTVNVTRRATAFVSSGRQFFFLTQESDVKKSDQRRVSEFFDFLPPQANGHKRAGCVPFFASFASVCRSTA